MPPGTDRWCSMLYISKRLVLDWRLEVFEVATDCGVMDTHINSVGAADMSQTDIASTWHLSQPNAMQGYQHQCGSAKCYPTATVTSVITTGTKECTLFARYNITTHQLLHVSVGTGPSSVADSRTEQLLKAVCRYLLTMCGQKHAAAGMTVTKLCAFVGSKCNARNGDCATVTSVRFTFTTINLRQY